MNKIIKFGLLFLIAIYLMWLTFYFSTSMVTSIDYTLLYVPFLSLLVSLYFYCSSKYKNRYSIPLSVSIFILLNGVCNYIQYQHDDSISIFSRYYHSDFSPQHNLKSGRVILEFDACQPADRRLDIILSPPSYLRKKERDHYQENLNLKLEIVGEDNGESLVSTTQDKWNFFLARDFNIISNGNGILHYKDQPLDFVIGRHKDSTVEQVFLRPGMYRFILSFDWPTDDDSRSILEELSFSTRLRIGTDFIREIDPAFFCSYK